MATNTELQYTPVIKIVTIRAGQTRAFRRFTSENCDMVAASVALGWPHRRTKS